MAENDPQDQPSGADLRAQFEQQLAAKDRELAFARAGIDVDTPLGRLFADGYKGENDVDAVKEAWSAVAPAPAAPAAPAAPPAPAAPVATDTAVFDEAGRLASGAIPPIGDVGPDPTQASVDAYWQARREGKSDRNAEALGFDMLFGAAARGDERVIIAGGRKGEE